MKRVVSIGGGSGQFVLLSGLRELPDIGITSIVSMVDSGGSTGRLRDELGVLPPGDILKCITALAEDPQATRRILLARFQANPRLRGHNAGNLLLTFCTTPLESRGGSSCTPTCWMTPARWRAMMPGNWQPS